MRKRFRAVFEYCLGAAKPFTCEVSHYGVKYVGYGDNLYGALADVKKEIDKADDPRKKEISHQNKKSKRRK